MGVERDYRRRVVPLRGGHESRARNWRRPWSALAGLFVLGAPGFGQNEDQREPSAVFRDATAETGVRFVHFIGASGELYFPEIVGAGAALFDFDDDGDLDLYLVQGAMLGELPLEEAAFPFEGQAPPMDRLLRNDLLRTETGVEVRFVDVTEGSGIRALGYGMGATTGDYDRDGDVDLYVTNFGSNQLWRNEGDGTFTDRTAEAGVDDVRWSVPAAFFDFDGDGWLDLFVGNYVDYRLATHKKCFSASGLRDYCSPASYPAETDRLWRNRGDGTFEEVTLRSGIGGEKAYALGAIPADFNDDGRLDLYVANDGVPNHLWINAGDGRFRDEALLAGCAVNSLGEPQASMGVDAADFDGDGDLDLFMTHLGKETNALFLNDGRGGFEESAERSGLGVASWRYTGFGTAFLDFDNDGLLDILVVNGAVYVDQELAAGGDPYPFDQPNQLFRNVGGGRFEEVTPGAGSVFSLAEVSRAATVGDLDNDGDTDVVVTNNNGRTRVLLNQVGNRRPWIGLSLMDAEGRLALGSRVGVFPGDGRALWRLSRVAGGYAGASDPRVLVGLGAAATEGESGSEASGQPSGTERVERIEVIWADGSREEWRNVKAHGYRTLRHGEGRPVREGSP